MVIAYVFAGIAVTSRSTAIDWYTRLFGEPPGMYPNDQEASWQLTNTSSVYVRVEPARAGRAIITLITEQLDGRLRELSERGVQSADVMEVPGAGRKAVLNDPDGNTVELVELNR